MRAGASVAKILRPGDMVLLTGEMASGKTTLIKAIAEALGSPDTVTSPTFALAQFYASPRGKILHIDTYRLADVAEFRDLGLTEYLDESITLVEWGEMVTGEFGSYLSIELSCDWESPDDRTIRFSAAGQRWLSDLAVLQAQVSEELQCR